jgi:hypothetical protein
MMNFSGKRHAEHIAALVSDRIRIAFGAIARYNSATKWTGDPCPICLSANKQRY